MKIKKSKIQLHLEETFQKLRAKKEAPESLKENVFETLQENEGTDAPEKDSPTSKTDADPKA